MSHQPDIEGVVRKGCRAIGVRKCPIRDQILAMVVVHCWKFADDMLLFVMCANALVHTVDALAISLQGAALKVTGKEKVTTQAQPDKILKSGAAMIL